MSGWASIVNASEADFNKLTDAINNSEGSAKKMADTMLEGSQGAIVEMKSALEGVAITIGERLTPFLEKLADGVSKVCQWFQNLSEEEREELLRENQPQYDTISEEPILQDSYYAKYWNPEEELPFQ